MGGPTVHSLKKGGGSKKAVMKQAWAKQGVGGNGRRLGRGSACRSGVETMRADAGFQPLVE